MRRGGLWLFGLVGVLGCIAVGMWWTRPIAGVQLSHPPGVRSLTTYRSGVLMVPEGVVPLKNGVYYYQHGNTVYFHFKGVMAGFVSDAGTVREQDVRTKDEFESVALGSDGTLWSTAILDNSAWPPVWHGAIERIDSSGSHVVFRVPDKFGYAKQLLVGPDAALWFALPDAHSVGRLSRDGRFTIVARVGRMKPEQIAFDSAGVLYAAGSGGHHIAKVLPGGKSVVYVVPAEGAEIGALAGGPNGGVWFTEQSTNRIGHLTSVGRIEEFSTGPGVSVSEAIAVDRDSVWFAEKGGIGRLSLRTHAFTVIRCPSRLAGPTPWPFRERVTCGSLNRSATKDAQASVEASDGSCRSDGRTTYPVAELTAEPERIGEGGLHELRRIVASARRSSRLISLGKAPPRGR